MHENGKNGMNWQHQVLVKMLEQLELSLIAGGNAKWGSHFQKSSLAISYEVKYTLTYDSPILLLGINPRDVKAMSNTKTHTWVFVVPN